MWERRKARLNCRSPKTPTIHPTREIMTRPKATAAALKQLSDEGDSANKDQATETLHTALSSGTSVVVAQAAELAGRVDLPRLARDLCAAFERFSGDGMRG